MFAKFMISNGYLYKIDRPKTSDTVLARAYYELKQFDESISEYKKAIDLDPNNDGGYNIGWALCYAGRAEEAIPYFEMMMRVSPKSSFPLLGLGDTKLFQGEYEDAIPYLQKAIEMNPKYFRMHLDLAACYAAQGREKEAKAAAEQVLKASPNFSIDKYINRGLPVKNIEDIKPYVDALRKIPFPVT